MALVTRTVAFPTSLSASTSESKFLGTSSLRPCPCSKTVSFVVRASKDDGRRGGGSGGLLDGTKKEITREDVLRNMEENESEKRSVFGAIPKTGTLDPSLDRFGRPEIERRPETGDRSFGSLMAFDGAGPETINGRLAMVGMVWAFVVERMTGLTVGQQLYTPGQSGLFYFLAVTQIIWYASLVPMFRGESPDSRVMGPWRAQAERWNGRTAMIGFLSLVITEAFTGSPVFNMHM